MYDDARLASMEEVASRIHEPTSKRQKRLLKAKSKFRHLARRIKNIAQPNYDPRDYRWAPLTTRR